MPPRAGGPARRIVMPLHGVGVNGDDPIGRAPAGASALPAAASVAPDVPEAYDMAPFGAHGFSQRDRRPQALLVGVWRLHRCSMHHAMTYRALSPGAVRAGWPEAPRRPC